MKLKKKERKEIIEHRGICYRWKIGVEKEHGESSVRERLDICPLRRVNTAEKRVSRDCVIVVAYLRAIRRNTFASRARLRNTCRGFLWNSNRCAILLGYLQPNETPSLLPLSFHIRCQSHLSLRLFEFLSKF